MKALLFASFTFLVSLSPLQTTGGTGTISGMVIQAGTDRPIDAVQISLSAVTSALGVSQPSAIGGFTDQFGRFEIGNLAAGRYRVQWTRPGYYTPPVGTAGPDASTIQSLKQQLGLDALFIASPPSATSVTVEIGVGEKQAGFVFTMIPGGVISGRVLDPMGNPLVSAPLMALTVNYEDGRRVLRPGTSTTSDDRGNFRLFGLRPGEYYIRAEHRASAAISSEIVHAYFPGVHRVTDAAPMVVNESGESPGANFSFPNGGTAKVSGTVNGPANMPRSNIQFLFLPVGTDDLENPADVVFSNSASLESRAVGEFELRGVPAGQYILGAIIFDTVQQRSWSGSVRLDVGTQDYRNVSMDMHAATDLKGRLVLEDGSPVRQSIMLRPLGDQASISRSPLYLGNRITTDPDGTFTVKQVIDARYSITQNATDSCIVDIHQGGKSVYDDGFVGGPDPEPIDVVLSNQCGTVQVQIVDDRKQAVSNAFVSLVPQGEHRKNPLLYRRSIYDVAAAKYPPISQIPPGEYKMFAWDNIPPNAELNAQFLAKFEERGTSVTVRRGESLTIELPLIRAKN